MAEKLRQSGLGYKEPGKLTRKGPSKDDLRADESAVIAQAVKVIGDKSEAMRWMGTPVRELNYSTPVSLLASAEGRDAVITVLGRLEHGVL
jgi:putative toxin-antitoxin system antitoxin component (TIGR02293 family)